MYKIKRVKKTALAMLPGSDLCEMASVSPNGRQGGLHRGIVLAGELDPVPYATSYKITNKTSE